MHLSTLINIDEHEAIITDRLLNTFNDERLSNTLTVSHHSLDRGYNHPTTWGFFDTASENKTIAENLYALRRHWSKQFNFGRATTKTEVYIYMFNKYFQLNRTYEIENIAQVMSFLDKHEHLVAFLLEADSQIRDIFGPVTLKLRLRQDSDHPEDLGLIGEIYSDLNVEDALTKLDEFDHKWFLNNARRTEGKVQFDVEWC